MIHNSFSQQQAWIEDQKSKAITTYPRLWGKIINEWSSTHTGDHLWLTYAANYLWHTGGVRWALDPYSLFSRVGQNNTIDYAGDLAPLQLIALSHWHSDHFDRVILPMLAHLPLIWIIPEFMQNGIRDKLPLRQLNLITPKLMQPITFEGLTLTPFKGLHFHGNCLGVPEMGYLAEFSGKRWLIPGDIRSYQPHLLPDFGPLDGILAHCWLGKAAALQPDEKTRHDFCKFFGSLNTQNIVVTHLNEFGRDADDLWTLEHFTLVKHCLQNIQSDRKVCAALMGDKIDL